MLSLGILSSSSTMQDFVNRALIWLPLAIIALTLHELGHAATAVALGDETPRQEGRVTLNPFAHLEPLGTLMMLFGPIGWAKPVRINPNALRGKHADLLVSFAGPGMNLLLAFLSAAALKYLNWGADLQVAQGLVESFFFLNIGLAVFNMLPIPPLDGGHIWPALLPRSLHRVYYNVLPYGMIALIALILWPGANRHLSKLSYEVARGIFALLP